MSGVRDILERALAESSRDTYDHSNNSALLEAAAREALAALDAEGVGLQEEIQRFADEMCGRSTVASRTINRICQDLLTHWEERRRSIPQPGQSPEPSAGLREALEWYAEQARDCRKMGRDGDRARQALDADGGARALAALNADEEQSDE